MVSIITFNLYWILPRIKYIGSFNTPAICINIINNFVVLIE